MSKEASGIPIDVKETQLSTGTQLENNQPIEQNDIILTPSLHKSKRVNLPPNFSGFHIETEEDTLISDRILSSIDQPSNYKEALVGYKAAKWKENMESDIQSMYDN